MTLRADRVRAVLPVGQFGDGEDRDSLVAFLSRRMPDGYNVAGRRDQGVVITATIMRAGQGAGAVSSATALLTALERVLESAGPRATAYLERALPRLTVKVSPASELEQRNAGAVLETNR